MLNPNLHFQISAFDFDANPENLLIWINGVALYPEGEHVHPYIVTNNQSSGEQQQHHQ